MKFVGNQPEQSRSVNTNDSHQVNVLNFDEAEQSALDWAAYTTLSDLSPVNTNETSTKVDAAEERPPPSPSTSRTTMQPRSTYNIQEGQGGRDEFETAGSVVAIDPALLDPSEAYDDSQAVQDGHDGRGTSDQDPHRPTQRAARQPVIVGGYPCVDCGKPFDRASDLGCHERIHYPETWQYECEDCEKKFPYPKDLKRHKEGVRDCAACPKRNGTTDAGPET